LLTFLILTLLVGSWDFESDTHLPIHLVHLVLVLDRSSALPRDFGSLVRYTYTWHVLLFFFLFHSWTWSRLVSFRQERKAASSHDFFFLVCLKSPSQSNPSDRYETFACSSLFLFYFTFFFCFATYIPCFALHTLSSIFPFPNSPPSLDVIYIHTQVYISAHSPARHASAGE